MPSVRLPFIPTTGDLNTAISIVQTGQYEPITGLELPSGLTAGAYFDLTESEAQALSDSSVGTLHTGRYQWVQLDSSAVLSGTGALQKGQALFSVPNAGPAPSYLVTNVPPSPNAAPIGIFLGAAPSVSGLAAGDYFFMQVIAPGRATVRMRATLSTSGTPAIGDSIFVVVGASPGAAAGLFDDIGGSGAPTDQTMEEAFNAFVGYAEAAPANGALVIVDIVKAGPFVI